MTEARTIRFKLNGAPVSVSVMPHETLVDILTHKLDLKGARESCGQGLCGCCTVYVDGQSVSSCLYLGQFVEGKNVSTIEGLSEASELDPVQQAFIDAGAFQCGFCTPGFIMMVRELLDTQPDPTEDDIRHYLIGNLCRCSTYPEIIEAVKLAASRRANRVGHPVVQEVRA